MSTSQNTQPSNSTTNIFLIVGAALLWLVASVYVGANGVEWFMPEAASVEADSVDDLFAFMLGIGTFIFLLVETTLIYFVVRYGFFRNRNDNTEGPPIHGNNTLEIIWTLIPSIIVFVLTIYSFQVLVDTTEAKDDEFVIDVVGQRFFWRFQYPNNVDDTELTSQHILVVPEGETIRLNMETIDVMHAFWVPEFRVKQDLLPGRTTELRFTPNQVTGLPDDMELVTLDDLDAPGPDDACPAEGELIAGEEETTDAAEDEADVSDEALAEAPPVNDERGYDIVCAELCGGNHGLMRGEVYVVERETYDAYLESLRAQRVAAQRQQEFAIRCGGEAVKEAGRALFIQYGCNTCHQLNDAGSLAMGSGPSLNGLGNRAANYAGYNSAEDYIMTSIINPNAFIVDGYAAGLMPQNFADQMTPDELDLLVAYLSLMTDE